MGKPGDTCFHVASFLILDDAHIARSCVWVVEVPEGNPEEYENMNTGKAATL